MIRLQIHKSFLLILGLTLSFNCYGQQGQIAIDRIDQMPDLPQPYIMRNWKQVAHQYDHFIYNLSISGEHLPLVGLKSSGTNYPALEPILLDTYVGTSSTNQAEAINIIPSIVSASLMGIDKSNQNGINWVEKTKDFFNAKNNQNVYLNGYNATSGNDWWYDLMPNIFFYQLTTFYDDPDYNTQFISVADQWLAAVNTMGASTTPWTIPEMNYRGWRLATMTGNANGVHEPEAAGAIAWLLYSAYVKTNDEKYLIGTQHALEFLSSLSNNPSYELQLPYGTLTAAKLNAIIGTGYDIDKMINWSFDRGALRGWGTIVGTWDGQEVSGLIGEANDNGNDYAFLMNGYQQAAAFAPLVKYDKRYAKAISKWILNLSNASRLLYPKYLNPSKQDDYNWSTEHDPQSVIAYEALKENWEGKTLYGTGDAKRNGWAATNLGLYGSSHVGYLAAIVDTTNVQGVLKLNLNATDFFGDNRHSSFSIYNPHPTAKSIIINVGDTLVDLYDAISETLIGDNVSGNFNFDLTGDHVMLITSLPAAAELVKDANKLIYDNFTVDYHYGYDFTPSMRIKSLATDKSEYEFNEPIKVYATVDHAAETTTYQWFVNGDEIETTNSGEWEWIAPTNEGALAINVTVSNGDSTFSAETTIFVTESIPQAPVIDSVTTNRMYYYENEVARIICHVRESETENLTYTWQASGGTFEQTDSLIQWTASAEGFFTITCTVNNEGLTSTASTTVLVKNETAPEIAPLAYYPLNVNTDDYSGNNYHATASGATKSDDAEGLPDFAYAINSTDDIIQVPNAASLNFADEITISCWIKISSTGREAFVLSHGSWEERWKLSITPGLKLRWTVKTNAGVKDLDSQEPVAANQFYHVTASFTGYSIELYINGELDNFSYHEGSILTTSHAITFGQKSASETEYFLNGVIDEVRLYEQSLQPWQISTLKTLWTEEIPTGIDEGFLKTATVFPNPVTNHYVTLNLPTDKIKAIRIMTTEGEIDTQEFLSLNGQTIIRLNEKTNGLVILQVTTESAVKHFKLFILR